MCIAIPAKVISATGQVAEIEINGCYKKVFLDLPHVTAGSWVLVYGNTAVAHLSDDEAKQSLQLIGQLEEAASKQIS